MHLFERRKSNRFQGKVPVEFAKGTGVTRDFGTSGIYFETDQSFSPDETLDFFMNLEHADVGPDARVRCLGEVVRVEPVGEKTGVAIAIQSFGLQVVPVPERR